MTSRNYSNAILARWAKNALQEYDRVSGGGCTTIATIPLTMASLAHLANQIAGNDIAGTEAFDEARKLFEFESTSEIAHLDKIARLRSAGFTVGARGHTKIIRVDGTVIEQDWDAMPGLDWLQGIVGGYIEVIPYWPEGVAFCNEEGKLDGLPVNRAANAIWKQVGDILVGDIVQLTGDAEFMDEL